MKDNNYLFKDIARLYLFYFKMLILMKVGDDSDKARQCYFKIQDR